MAKKGKDNAKQSGPASIQNRRARYDYEIQDSYEAGIALVGSEVKSAYLGRVNLADAFCKIVNGELWLVNCHVEPYSHSSVYLPDRRRDRKLLMHRKEINTLERKAMEKGFALLALGMYFKNGRVKVQVGLGIGKKTYDKRTQIAEKETRREKERMRSEKY